MTIRPLVPVVLLSACLTFCGAPPPPPQTQAPVTAAPASGVDGVYRGSSTRFQADSRSCPHPGLLDLTVQGGQFEFRWNSTVYVDAAIAANGSAQGAAGDVTLSGRLDGNTLSGDVSSAACGLHFTATRQG